MQAMLVNMATYSWAVNRIEVAPDKVQHYSKLGYDLYLPTKDKLEARVGRMWKDETPEQRKVILEGPVRIPSTEKHTLLGCTMVYGKGAREPENLKEIRHDTQEQLERYRAGPAAAAMVIDSVVATRWYAVYSVYRPPQQVHDSNDALQRRCFKHMCGISRYAKVEAISAPQQDSGMGVVGA